jgi:Nuclease-related domain
MQRIEELRAERIRARKSRRIGKWLSASLKLVALPGSPPQPRPIEPSQEEYRKAAGVEGEDGVIDHLAARLGDEWRALRGYRNHRGEIDVLLLGPKGLFALEIKNINVTIVCNGDHWHYQKYDKYGNPVGAGGTLTDDAGRSPSQQLNEPTDELIAALARRYPQMWIQRIVVLFNPRGWVDIDSSTLTVAVANEVDFVLQLIAESRVEIPPDAIPELEAMIVADHRRRNRSAPASPRPAK